MERSTTDEPVRGLPPEAAVEGVAVSPGIAVGPAFVFGDILTEVETRTIRPDEVEGELARFRAAVELVKDELARDVERISEQLGQDHADVFLVHSMILEDRSAITEIEGHVRTGLVNAEAAVAEVMKRVSAVLAASGDSYLRDRAFDITDIGKRVIERLLGVWSHCPLVQPMVVVATELRASDTVTMDRGRILGFVTEVGGKESHAAILARSLGVPAIVGVPGIVDRVVTGDVLIVDGDDGCVVLHPSEAALDRYGLKREEDEREWADLSSLRDLPTETADGVKVELMCNVGSVDDAAEAAGMNAAGVGLFRTEMVFMASRHFLDEEEQYSTYRSVVEAMPGRPVVIRTLDIGGDKFVGPENPYRERNPNLGYRSIRVLLERPDIFLTQMRAILRAGAHGDARILWPMICTLGELRAAKERLGEAKDALRKEGVPFREDTPAGVMIEIPSAALLAERLAAECDFLSIGTNDLIQYTLAVDRGSSLVDHLYRPHDPAVIALIARTVEGARAAGKPVALCGEMGGNPAYVPLVLGLGLEEISVSPARFLLAKKAIRETDLAKARELTSRALAAGTAEEVEVIFDLERS